MQFQTAKITAVAVASAHKWLLAGVDYRSKSLQKE